MVFRSESGVSVLSVDGSYLVFQTDGFALTIMWYLESTRSVIFTPAHSHTWTQANDPGCLYLGLSLQKDHIAVAIVTAF